MFHTSAEMEDLLQKHLQYRQSCLNLIASENNASDFVRKQLCGDFGNRYGCYETGDPANREYTGNQYIHEFEMHTQEMVCDIFHAKYADLRPLSGHMAGMAVGLALLRTNDLVIEVSLEDWGHGLMGPICQIEQLGKTIRVAYMPFDENRAVDLKGLEAQVRELKPQMVIFGGSGTLFAEPVRAFRSIADELDILVAYDAAHVTGLIAGGCMPNPLDEGADIMFGSTHKSFPGPQGGFIVSNRWDLMEKVGRALSPSLVTSHHIQRLPALAAAMMEIKQFGNAYATQIIKNTKALSKYLADMGFVVCGKARGYSDTHIILLDITAQHINGSIAKRLEKANILCSDTFAGDAADIRLGTQEVTRQGMHEADMEQIALFFKRILIDQEDPLSVKKEVEDFSRKFGGISYSL